MAGTSLQEGSLKENDKRKSTYTQNQEKTHNEKGRCGNLMGHIEGKRDQGRRQAT